jgi:hypothetical protein
VTNDLENLVRAAQERQAEQAVHPDRIRAALPARAARLARRRRYTALGAGAAAVATAAALAIPVLALRGGTGGSAAPPANTGAPAVTVTLTTVALRYRPTWLPTGVAERIRIAPLEAATGEPFAGPIRMWTPQPVGTDGRWGGTGLGLHVRHAQGADDPQANDGKLVDINGKPGYYHGTPGDEKAYLEWRADSDTVVSVDQLRLGLTEADLVRVARSVRPDPGQQRAPLALGWLPDGMNLSSIEVSGDSPAAWLATLSAEDRHLTKDLSSHKESKEGPRAITVSVSPTTTAPPGGEELVVGGHPARLVSRSDIPNMWYLVVNLGPGRLLTVVASWPVARPLTRDDLIRVAEQTTVDDQADVSWIGGP